MEVCLPTYLTKNTDECLRIDEISLDEKTA